ncbi:hypothetical protein K469DRAFT_702722 [Zopfia rhizophila CBS 207.26]|uniref:C2H2-type domain-containing protein n=1 Tax=Zopfia rhizophila CBS 207.26 TaxID=1314779 RepID=A0A6A6ED93_9PEZI|nr:hypothetical protein K469DRAFT_702722 [Zopfia rhizophila CBS 207.26]
MGYDPVAVKMVCPMCTDNFQTQEDFKEHLMKMHLTANHLQFKGPVPSSWKLDWTAPYFHCMICGSPQYGPYDCGCRHRFAEYICDPDQIRPFRRSILRLWPEFCFYPVFDDLKSIE